MRTIGIAVEGNRASRGGRKGASRRRNDVQCIAAHADYRREDYVFARQQSLAMRGLEWESRLKPIRPWGSNLVANIAWDIFN